MCSGIHNFLFFFTEAQKQQLIEPVNSLSFREKVDEEREEKEKKKMMIMMMKKKNIKKTFKDSEYVQAPIRFLREAY